MLEVRAPELQAVVLSHGHSDHTTGLLGLVDRLGDRRLPMVVHPDAYLERKIVFPNGREWRMPTPLLADFRKGGLDVIQEVGPSMLVDNMVLVSGEVERTTSFERGLPPQWAKRNGAWEPDPLTHDDQCAIVRVKGKGLVVVSGCGHAGIINTVRHAQTLTGEQRVYAVIGGFHLNGQLFEPIIPQTVRALVELNPRYIVPGHCTGFPATMQIALAMPQAYLDQQRRHDLRSLICQCVFCSPASVPRVTSTLLCRSPNWRSRPVMKSLSPAGRPSAPPSRRPALPPTRPDSTTPAQRWTPGFHSSNSSRATRTFNLSLARSASRHRPAISAAQAQLYVELLLDRAGLDASDVEFTTLASPDMVAGLNGRAIDAAWEVEPLIGAIQSQRLGTLISTGFEALPGGIPWILFESPGFARTGLAGRAAVMRAYVRRMRDFYHAFDRKDGPSGPVIDSLAAHSSVHDASVLRTIAMPTVDPNGELDVAVLDRYQDYYLRTGDQSQKVDLSGYVDPAPLATALAELGRL